MKTILFVDDEPNILGALRRGMRRMRKEWRMLFAENGPEALELLDLHPVNALVSDMRMPHMHGGELVRRVRQKSPSVVRIGLSGYSETEQMVSSSSAFHQFWSKPLACEAITANLRFLFRVGDMLPEPVRAKLCALDSIPSDEDTLNAFRTEAQRAEKDPETLSTQVRSDLGLYCRVAKLFNTCFLGGPRQLNDSSDLLLSLDWLVQVIEEGEPESSHRPLTPAPPLDPLVALASEFSALDGTDKMLQGKVWTAARLTELSGRLAPILELTDPTILAWSSAYLATLWGFSEEVVGALSPLPDPDNQINFYLNLTRGALGSEPNLTESFERWSQEHGRPAQALLERSQTTIG